jgi:hypothetical protein
VHFRTGALASCAATMGRHGDSDSEEEIEVTMSQMPTNKNLHAVRPGSP